jgi:hypothetical protein
MRLGGGTGLSCCRHGHFVNQHRHDLILSISASAEGRQININKLFIAIYQQPEPERDEEDIHAPLLPSPPFL